MKHYTQASHPVAIFIRGLPGSGKSYLADALAEAIGREKVVNLDPDATDYTSEEYAQHANAMAAEGVDAELHPYRFLRAQAYEAIAAKKIIIWNQPFTNLEIFRKMADRLQDRAAECSTELPMLVVEVEVDAAIAKNRVEARKSMGGHGPSDGTFRRRVSDYGSFEGEGFRVVKVKGDADVGRSVAAIMQALNSVSV